MTSHNIADLIEPAVRLAKQAGEAILYWYQHPEQLDIQRKVDKSYVTSADIASNDILCEGLEALGFQWPIISEETTLVDFDERKGWQQFWLLDPLDGTHGFVNRLDEFSVNIALIKDSKPVLGVIYSPVQKCCYYAYQGGGAFLQEAGKPPQPIRTQMINFDKLRFIVGRYHRSKRMESVLKRFPGSVLLRVNSSLKFTCLAEGSADVYPRFGAISEWDIAAGHCILAEAGGAIVDFSGESLQYNTKASLLCPAFLAVGDPAQADRLFEAFTPRHPGI